MGVDMFRIHSVCIMTAVWTSLYMYSYHVTCQLCPHTIINRTQCRSTSHYRCSAFFNEVSSLSCLATLACRGRPYTTTLSYSLQPSLIPRPQSSPPPPPPICDHVVYMYMLSSLNAMHGLVYLCSCCVVLFLHIFFKASQPRGRASS